MVDHPVIPAIPDFPLRVNKAALREYLKQVPYRFINAASFNTFSLPDVPIAIIANSLYYYDAADSTTADDGVQCIHDADARRFKIFNVSVAGADGAIQYNNSGVAGGISLSASELVGRGPSGGTAPIDLGNGLEISGTTLQLPTKIICNKSIGTGSELVVDSSEITRAYNEIEILIDSWSHNNGSSRSLTLSLSCDNGSTISGAHIISASMAAASNGECRILLARNSATQSFLHAISSTGNVPDFIESLAFTPGAGGPINWFRLALSGAVGSFDGGFVYAIGRI